MKRKLFITTGAILLFFLTAFAQHPRNVMIYNVTSTGCGPCSCMDSIYTNSVLDSFPNTVIVAFHNIGSVFKDYQGNDIVKHFKPKFEPSGWPDGLGHDVYSHYILDTVAKRYNQVPETPVAIEIDSKIWDPVLRTVDLTVTIRNDGPDMEGAYWYNVIVTEDNILAWHYTWDSCSTHNIYPPGIDTTYFNNWVTRRMVYCVNGDSLIGPSWPEQQSITRSTNFLLNDAWVAENCNIVINVYKKADSIFRSPVLQVIKESIIPTSVIPDAETVKEGITNVYPNPATDISNLHISLSTGSLCSLNIYDLNGRKIKTILQGYVKPGSYNIELDTEEYQAGTYLVCLETDKGKSWKKIIVL